MVNKIIFVLALVLLTCAKIVGNTIIPIHTGKFYTNRNHTKRDTIFLPVDQQYTIKFSVCRYVDSVIMIDNQGYRLLVKDMDYPQEYSNLQNHPNDWPLYKYLVVSYKTIIPMFVTIYDQTDSITDIWLKRPIDVIYYMSQTISDNCFEAYQSYQQTDIGIYMLKYMSLFKYYLQQKIEKEITIVSDQSGDFLRDDLYVVILPCKDGVRIKEGGVNLLEAPNSTQ